MAREIRNFRKLRHWKQRFNKNAKFIWRKAILFDGEKTEMGAPIPESLDANKTKLRRFWEAGTIELAEFEAPDVATGQIPDPTDLPEGVTVTSGKGNWFVVVIGEEKQKVNGKKALKALLDELREEDG